MGSGYRRLSRVYRAMEFLAFGADLERARFAHLGSLSGRRRILILGEGDGRCVERLSRQNPGAAIVCVDASRDMIERARARLEGSGLGANVRWVCADALCADLSGEPFDAVVTFFFLDCFEEEPVSRLVPRVGASLTEDALWLFADFVEPRGGLARLRARAWLTVLYAFFRWETGLAVSRLPPSEELLARNGWTPVASLELQHGLLRSSVLSRVSGAPTGAPPASP